MKKYLKLKSLNSAGDTIVEVLIVLAILGFAFTLASVTAKKGLDQSRNAEEHSQAMGILSSQIELVRKAVAVQATLPTDPSTPFCMVGAAAETNMATCNGLDPNQRYSPIITYVPAVTGSGAHPAYYQLKVGWQGIGDLGSQQEVMNYRTFPLTATSNSSIVLSANRSSLKVDIEVIPPIVDTVGNRGSQTPSCSDAGRTASPDGTVVTLTQTNGAGTTATATTTNSIAFFDDLTAGGVYKATFAPPATYVACPPSPAGSDSTTVLAGPTNPIKLQMYQTCHDETITDPDTYTYKQVDVYNDYYTDDPVYGDPTYYWAHTGPDAVYYSPPPSPVYGKANSVNGDFGAKAPPPGGSGWIAYELDSSARSTYNQFTSQANPAPIDHYDHNFHHDYVRTDTVVDQTIHHSHIHGVCP